VKPIKGQFIFYIEHDQQATSYTQCKARYVDERVTFVFNKVSEGGFKIVF